MIEITKSELHKYIVKEVRELIENESFLPKKRRGIIKISRKDPRYTVVKDNIIRQLEIVRDNITSLEGTCINVREKVTHLISDIENNCRPAGPA